MSENHVPAPPEESGQAHPPKKRAKKYIFSVLFMLALIAVTFYIIFRDRTILDIFKVLNDVSLPFVGAGALSMLMSLVVQGLIIGMAARWIKIRLRLGTMLQYSFVGFFFSAITPSSTGGQPMQFYYMARDGIHYSDTTLTLFITNITYQLSVVIMGLAMVILKWRFVAETRENIFIFFFLGLAVNLFMLAVLAIALFSEKLLLNLLRGAEKLLAKLKIIKDPEKALRGLDKYIGEVKAGVTLIKASPGRFLAITGATLVQLILNYLVPWFVYLSFGLSGYSWLDFLAISAVLYVSVSFLPLPGSVGASESGFVMLFRPLFMASILPGMLVSRFINFYIMLVLSGLICLYIHLRKPYHLNG